jgi:hypothetical protein
MALFGAAFFQNRLQASLLPLAALWLSDLAINNLIYARYFEGFTLFHAGFYWTYGAFLVIGLLGGMLLRKVNPGRLFMASLMASSFFFLISNFGVWASGTMYPLNAGGLVACYTAALPFFANTLAGDLVYSSVLFGAFELARTQFSVLQLQKG